MLILEDSLLIGAGGHQAVYIHPEDFRKCVKVAFDPDDGDVKKELRYRKMCASKLEKSKLITRYFGKVDTDRGEGLIFERVIDFDGKSSLDLNDYLKATYDKPMFAARRLLLDFKQEFLHEAIAIVDTDITNFMVQMVNRGTPRMRIVDNIGTPALIPLVYFSNTLARWKARRVWNRIADWLHDHYPVIVDNKFHVELRAT